MEFKDWASWVGIVVSLGWNAFNTVRSEVRASRTAAFNEFKTLKSSADTALIELRSRKLALRGLEAHADDGFKERLQEINKEIIESSVKLVTALEILDQSTHSKKVNWTELYNDRWDDFLDSLQQIYAQKNKSARNSHIVSAVKQLDIFLSSTQKDLESEGAGILTPSSSSSVTNRGNLIKIATLVIIILLCFMIPSAVEFVERSILK